MNPDTTDTIVKISAVIVSLLTTTFIIYKNIIDAKAQKHNKLKEELELTKNFIELCKNENEHPLIIEKYFETLCHEQLSAKAIRCLIQTPKPLELINCYPVAKQYIDFDEPSNAFRFKKSLNKRKKYKTHCFVAYFILAAATISPFLFSEKLGLRGITGLIIALIWSIPMGYMAFIFLKEAARLNSIEKKFNFLK